MRPELVRAKVTKLKTWADKEFSKLDEKRNKIERAIETLHERVNGKIQKLYERCKHDFDALSRDGKNFVCLCGATREARREQA